MAKPPRGAQVQKLGGAKHFAVEDRLRPVGKRPLVAGIRQPREAVLRREGKGLRPGNDSARSQSRKGGAQEISITGSAVRTKKSGCGETFLDGSIRFGDDDRGKADGGA